MKERKFMFLILSFALSVFLTGCAKQEPKQELLMWLVGSESQAKAIQNIGDEFFKDKGISFRCEAISWADAYTKYLTSLAAGVAPDIATMGLTWGTEFGTLGAMVDLAKEFPEDIKQIKEKIFPGLRDSLEYKGSIYAIPFDLSVQIMFYRRDIIANPPATWAELVNRLKSLKEQGRGMIFDWGSISWIGYAPYLWQAGGDFYNSDNTKSALDKDEAAQALKFFAALYTDLGVPKTRIPLEQGMRTGDFPLAISGNWKIDSLRLTAPQIKGKWSIALLPAGPTGRRTAFLGGRVIGVFSKSKNKLAAFEFIKFLFEPRTEARLFEQARSSQDSYLPANISAWEILPLEAEFKQILIAQAEDALGPPSVLNWDEATRFIEEAIQRVILEKADPKEALAKAAGEINALAPIARQIH